VALERDKVAGEFARLITLRSEFHAAAAATRDRLRDAWAAVEGQQQRTTVDWTEAERYFAEQTAQLDARAADLAQREKAVADSRARGEAEVVGLREEAAALDSRIENARTALAEIEAQRERARAELLQAPPDLPVPAAAESGDFAEREAALAREKQAVAALKESLEREAAELTDRKRVIAEQLALLTEARAKWQKAERQTVIEMEEMARDLKNRETEIENRERRLIRADKRRRDDAYDLWQLRLKLESWQTKLTAFEVRWHTEREELETDLQRRTATLAQRESEVEETFKKWEKARAAERERLRAELDHWAADRERLAKAAAAVDLQRQMHDAELSTCAARALAAEEIVTAATKDGGSERMKRRLAVLRKRWERLFDRKVKEIDRRRAAMTAELNTLTDRYYRLHELLAAMVEREAVSNNTAASADLERVIVGPLKLPAATRREPTVVPELAALRAELERVAVVMLDMELPDPPEPADHDLPWGSEEEPYAHPSVFQFDAAARAA
jgi:chromosome segregation ATPase